MSIEKHNPASCQTAVRRSALSRSDYMRKVVRYYNGEDDWKYKCIDIYEKVKNAQSWEICPNCGLFPKIWEFDNGRVTACGCGKNQYEKFTIFAESVMSVCKNSHNGQSATDYDLDALRKNWNHWAKTGELLFIRGNGRW
jgi:hypothetical protein